MFIDLAPDDGRIISFEKEYGDILSTVQISFMILCTG